MLGADQAMVKTMKKYLRNYQAPKFFVEDVFLNFDLTSNKTKVLSKMTIKRNSHFVEDSDDWQLYGDNLRLISVRVQGKALSPDEYYLDDSGLIIQSVPDQAVIEIINEIDPDQNTQLEGLYASSGMLCTQCEPEGFRRITYFPDRPDILTRFTVCLNADEDQYPVLLSNGNLTDAGSLDHGRHYAIWQDPFPKPCYLFALVAGRLEYIEDHHTTPSGRQIRLRIYVESHNIDKCDHAMQSLKKAMIWDEENYGREYDLDDYMIVAVDDFNMGAMENKGLNIFNSKYVLSRPDCATDDDYIHIESVIAHEYFHNWTGNRVTCRDWFQLALKEGLTVFRDQCFTEDSTLGFLKRIDDVRLLRSRQFPEDSGPLAHPVRPEYYQQINNFYTLTVYEKGAELVRMLRTLLGSKGFRRGMDLYFKRFDGKAVTIEDFLSSLEDANDEDLSLFLGWYQRKGTPTLKVTDHWNEQTKTYSLTLEQIFPEHHDGGNAPLLIPFAVGFVLTPSEIGEENHDSDVTWSSTKILRLNAMKETFQFADLPAKPIPSLNRGFSAPVYVDYSYHPHELVHLSLYDADLVNRWDAIQKIFKDILLSFIQSEAEDFDFSENDTINFLLEETIRASAADPGFVAAALHVPSESELIEKIRPINPHRIHRVRESFLSWMGANWWDEWLNLYHQYSMINKTGFNVHQATSRKLANLALHYLMKGGGNDSIDIAYEQYQQAQNFTDLYSALQVLVEAGAPEADQCLNDFEYRWQEESLVMDRWFALQVMRPGIDGLSCAKKLVHHPLFKLHNPNRVRSVLHTFAMQNLTGFHLIDGSGYEFIAEWILKLDQHNPQVASRLASVFSHWKDYDRPLREKMRVALTGIMEHNLSTDVYEILSNSLESGHE